MEVENLNITLEKCLIGIDSVESYGDLINKLDERLKDSLTENWKNIEYAYEILKEEKSLLEDEFWAELKLLFVQNPEKQM